MSRSIFDIGHDDLVGLLVVAAVKAGAATSGGVFDPTGPTRVVELRHLRGIVLARLEGKNPPPFRPGDKVSLKETNHGRTIHARDFEGFSTSSKTLKGNGPFVIYRIWYYGEKWSLSLLSPERDELLYDCDLFQPVEATAPTTA